LPDVLQLISANVRAGMTVDKAIWLSARPEFGILEEEVRKVGAKTMGGKPINLALKEMSKKIKSKILDRTVKLIIEGIESGGDLAKLLDETSSNIRTTQSLRKEIRSSVMMYSIFILFAAVLGAPMLQLVLLLVDLVLQEWQEFKLLQKNYFILQ
ncbi:MAG: type II secretion system F family protein, partial [Methanosarcinales archaeon]